MKEQMKNCRYPSTRSPTFDEKAMFCWWKIDFIEWKIDFLLHWRNRLFINSLVLSEKIDVSPINRFLFMKKSILSPKESMFNQNVNMFIKKLNLSWKNRFFVKIWFFAKTSIFWWRNLFSWSEIYLFIKKSMFPLILS